MNHVGAIPEGSDQWISHCLGGMFTSDHEEAHFMMNNLLDHQNYDQMLPNTAIQHDFWPGNEELTLMNVFGNFGSSPDCSLDSSRSLLNGSSEEGDVFLSSTYPFHNLSCCPPPLNRVTKNVINRNGDNFICDAEAIDTSLYLIQEEGDMCIDGNIMMEDHNSYQCDEPANIIMDHENSNTSSNMNSMKRPKASSENDQMMNKRSRKSKKRCNKEEGNHDENASELMMTEGLKEDAALNLNGKRRATRGSATDAQSVYARRRRERINERLKLLQNLVPNGRKVDISTMLEEAVNYVKFLQLQIKMLSSDDLWMYAPICYNGMVFGLDGDESSQANAILER